LTPSTGPSDVLLRESEPLQVQQARDWDALGAIMKDFLAWACLRRSWLACERNVVASAQTQALSALSLLDRMP